jgi:putative aldouronate transport system permease protein
MQVDFFKEGKGVSPNEPEKSRFVKNLYKYKGYYILLIPGILYFLIFCYLPMFGILIAFENYSPFKGVFGSRWVGLANFRMLFNSDEFWRVFTNTFLISFYKLVYGFPAPLIFALLINELRRTSFKKVFQTISYLPHFISWVFVTGFIYIIFSVDNGLVNGLLLKFHIINEAVPFLATPQVVPPLVILSQVWKTFGWNSIIYIAAITNIDPTMYEAATVDGAKRFARIWYITLPSIKPTIVILLIFSIGGLISANFGLFEQMYLLSNSMIQDATEIVDTYTYKMGIVLSRYSYATAVGLFRSVAAVILLAGANFTSKKMTGESLY